MEPSKEPKAVPPAPPLLSRGGGGGGGLPVLGPCWAADAHAALVLSPLKEAVKPHL